MLAKKIEKGKQMSEEQNQDNAIIAEDQDAEYEIDHLDQTQGNEAEEFALKVIKLLHH